MKKILLGGAVALSMLAGCASGPTIRTNADPSANLSSYKTYMFAEKTGTDGAALLDSNHQLFQGIDPPRNGLARLQVRRGRPG